MEKRFYEITGQDNILDICDKYNVSIETIVSQNYFLYPSLMENPYMIFKNWTLTIPVIGNGGNTQYDLGV